MTITVPLVFANHLPLLRLQRFLPVTVYRSMPMQAT